MTRATKAAFGAFLSIASISVSACEVPHVASDEFRAIINKEGGWPVSEDECKYLKDHHLFLDVVADDGVINNAAYSWVVLHIRDQYGFVSTEFSNETYVRTTHVSNDAADSNLQKALHEAVESLDFDTAYSQLQDMEKQLKTR